MAFHVAENESAFDLLYCITFKLMDHQWLAMHASYMDFNVCAIELYILPLRVKFLCLFEIPQPHHAGEKKNK